MVVKNYMVELLFNGKNHDWGFLSPNKLEGAEYLDKFFDKSNREVMIYRVGNCTCIFKGGEVSISGRLEENISTGCAVLKTAISNLGPEYKLKLEEITEK